jgi:hypothetical protein
LTPATSVVYFLCRNGLGSNGYEQGVTSMGGLTAAIEREARARREYQLAQEMVSETRRALDEARREADRLRLISATDVYEEHGTGVRHVVCDIHEAELVAPCWWVGPAERDAVCAACVALGWGEQGVKA